MIVFTQAILIFVACLAVGVLFSLPKRALGVAACIACVGYTIKELLSSGGASTPEASFLGAYVVAQSAELLARRLKMPSVVLSIPGIIPLVPGSIAYAAVTHLVRGREMMGLETGVEALLAAFGIASGLLLARSLSVKLFRLGAH